MKINRGVMASLICLATLFICCNKKRTYSENKSDGLTVQATEIPAGASETGVVNYSARLIPDNALSAAKNGETKTALWYSMDSCFYLQAGNKKIYANLTQPIANGVTGTFEYLLSFEITRQSDVQYSLIYQDKYLNHKKYELKFY